MTANGSSAGGRNRVRFRLEFNCGLIELEVWPDHTRISVGLQLKSDIIPLANVTVDTRRWRVKLRQILTAIRPDFDCNLAEL